MQRPRGKSKLVLADDDEKPSADGAECEAGVGGGEWTGQRGQDRGDMGKALTQNAKLQGEPKTSVIETSNILMKDFQIKCMQKTHRVKNVNNPVLVRVPL